MQYWYKQEGVINKEYLDKEYREASLLANSEEQREKVSSIYKLVQNKYKRIEEKRQAEEDENWEKLIGEAEGKYKEAKFGLFGLIAWTIIYIILFLILKSNESIHRIYNCFLFRNRFGSFCADSNIFINTDYKRDRKCKKTFGCMSKT